MNTDLLTAKDVKRMLKVSLPYVYRLVEQGRIPCVRIPCPGKGTEKSRNLVRFRPEDIDKFINRHYQN